MSEMLHKVDTIIHVKKPSGEHISPSITKVFDDILNAPLCERVFDVQEGDSSFPHFILSWQ